MAEPTIEQVCGNLNAYYEFMKVKYENDDGEAVFSAMCESSGFDDEMMNDDLNGTVDQSMLVDELSGIEFPLPDDLKTSKDEYIYKILRKCCQPNPSFADLASELPTECMLCYSCIFS